MVRSVLQYDINNNTIEALLINMCGVVRAVFKIKAVIYF